MQRVAFLVHHHAVAGVGAAVVAHNHIVLRCQQVDNLALAFVTPLQTNNGCIFYFFHGVILRDGLGDLYRDCRQNEAVHRILLIETPTFSLEAFCSQLTFYVRTL